MGKWVPILIIDDDELVRIELKRTLKLYGFKVYLAKDGPTGLELAKKKKPKFVLLDWMMPGMNGLETLSELKHSKDTMHIPVFMLTDKGMIGNLDEAFEMGVDSYIIKPLELIELGKVVKDRWKKYTNHVSVR